MANGTTAKVLDFNQPESAKVVGREIESTTQSLVSRLAVDGKITDQAGAQQAVDDRQMIGEMIKRVEEFFTPFKKMAYDLHKALCTRETEILAPLQRVDVLKRAALGAYKIEQDKVRLARERELAEQLRLEQQARAADEAAALESAGDHEMAEAVMEEAIAAPAPVAIVANALKQVAGLKYRTEWKWRPVGGNEARACQLVPREYMCLDTKKLNAYAKAMGASAKVPGIEFFSEQLPVR